MDSLASTPNKRKRKTTRSASPILSEAWGARVGRGVGVFATVMALAIAFLLFKHAYYVTNERFFVTPENIQVSGNATFSQENLLAYFDIHQPKNGFQLVESDIVTKLQEFMPILKEVKMTYLQHDRVQLWVEERMPVAKIAGDIRPPLFVDDEGVIFVYPKWSTGKYPEISGFDLPEEMMPGKRLPEQLHCMLRLLSVVSDTTTYFNSAVERISLLGVDPDDGLLITLNDGRKIEIAWDNMAAEKEKSEGMIRRLENLSRVLRSPAANGKKHFNAMAADRVAVSE